MSQINTLVHGQSFNAVNVASKTEDEFVKNNLNRYFHGNKLEFREKKLREIYQACLADVKKFAPDKLPVATPVQDPPPSPPGKKGKDKDNLPPVPES